MIKNINIKYIKYNKMIRFDLPNFQNVQTFFVDDIDDIVSGRYDDNNNILLNNNKKTSENSFMIKLKKNNIVVATDYFNYFLYKNTPDSRSISFEYLLSMYNDTNYGIDTTYFCYKYAIDYMFRKNLWLRTNYFNTASKKDSEKKDYGHIDKKRKTEEEKAAHNMINIILGAPVYLPCIDPKFIKNNYRYYDLLDKTIPIPENSRTGFIGKYEPDPFCCTNHQIAILDPQLKFGCDVRPEEGSDNYKKLMIDRLDYLPECPYEMKKGEIVEKNKENTGKIILEIVNKIKCSLREHNNPVFCTYKSKYIGELKIPPPDYTHFYDVLIIGYITEVLPIKNRGGKDLKILLWKVRSPVYNKGLRMNIYILSDLTYSYIGRNHTQLNDLLDKLEKKYKIYIIRNVEAFDLIELTSFKGDFIKTGCKFIPYLKFDYGIYEI